MDSIIKQTIDARKSVIFDNYNITDKSLIDKIEDLFIRINEFGEKFDDVNKFEAEFAKSTLNSEYTNIFIQLANIEVKNNMPSVGEVVADRIGSEVKNRIIPSRAVRADARDKALRNIPVVGDIINSRQKLDLLNKFRKKK